MNIAHRARVILVRTGKGFPFILCFLLFVIYAETAFALTTSNFCVCNGYVVPYTPLSWIVSNASEYSMLTIYVLCILSVAVETCIHNKIACAYLIANLAEKHFFCFEFEMWQVVAISLFNMLVCGYLTIKGLKAITKK